MLPIALFHQFINCNRYLLVFVKQWIQNLFYCFEMLIRRLSWCLSFDSSATQVFCFIKSLRLLIQFKERTISFQEQKVEHRTGGSHTRSNAGTGQESVKRKENHYWEWQISSNTSLNAIGFIYRGIIKLFYVGLKK